MLPWCTPLSCLCILSDASPTTVGNSFWRWCAEAVGSSRRRRWCASPSPRKHPPFGPGGPAGPRVVVVENATRLVQWVAHCRPRPSAASPVSSPGPPTREIMLGSLSSITFKESIYEDRMILNKMPYRKIVYANIYCNVLEQRNRITSSGIKLSY